MILFGLYSTPSINKFIVELGREIDEKLGVESIYIAWGGDAAAELQAFGVAPIFLPEPNPFQRDYSNSFPSHCSQVTAYNYDIQWLIEVEEHFEFTGRNKNSLVSEAVCAIEYYENLFLMARPKMVVLWNGEQLYNRILRSIARHIGVPVIFIERGPLADTLFVDREGVNAAASFVGHKMPAPTPDGLQWARGRVEQYLIDNESAWGQPELVDESLLFQRVGITGCEKLILLPPRLMKILI